MGVGSSKIIPWTPQKLIKETAINCNKGREIYSALKASQKHGKCFIIYFINYVIAMSTDKICKSNHLLMKRVWWIAPKIFLRSLPQRVKPFASCQFVLLAHMTLGFPRSSPGTWSLTSKAYSKMAAKHNPALRPNMMAIFWYEYSQCGYSSIHRKCAVRITTWCM